MSFPPVHRHAVWIDGFIPLLHRVFPNICSAQWSALFTAKRWSSRFDLLAGQVTACFPVFFPEASINTNQLDKYLFFVQSGIILYSVDIVIKRGN